MRIEAAPATSSAIAAALNASSADAGQALTWNGSALAWATPTFTPGDDVDLLNVVGQVPAVVNQAATDDVPYWVFCYQNYAYVCCQTNGTLQIFDIQIPTAPVLISTTAVDAFARSVYVTGRYAYVASFNANTLKVLDVSDKKAPTIVGSVATSTQPRSVVVQGRYAFLTGFDSNFLEIVDVKNPASPVVVGSISTGASSNPMSVVLQGKYAFVVLRVAKVLRAYDISNPASPSAVGDVALGTEALYVSVQGRYAYVANRTDDTLQVIDISDPTAMATVATFGTGDAPFHAIARGNRCYISLNSGGFQVIDITDPENPSNVGTLAFSGSPALEVMTVHGQYAYITDTTNSMLDVVYLGGSYIQELEGGGAKFTSVTIERLLQAGDIAANGGLHVSGSAQFDNNIGVIGTADLTNIVFSQDPEANLYRSAADTVKTDGTFVAAANLQALAQVVAPSGSAATPAFMFAGQTLGFRRNGNAFTIVNASADHVTLGISGVDVTPGTGNVVSNAGTVTAPGFKFGGVQSGWYRPGGNSIAATVNGVQQLLLDGTNVTVASGIGLKLGNAATTGLSAGALAATTNASIVLTDSAGQAYRIPCII